MKKFMKRMFSITFMFLLVGIFCCVMDTVTTVQENAEDIYEEAKQINEDRAAAEEEMEAYAEAADDEEATEEVSEDAFKEVEE